MLAATLREALTLTKCVLNGRGDDLMFVYKTNIMEKLRKAGYNPSRIHHEKILPDGTVQKLRTGEMIGIITLEKLCALLNVQPSSIIRHIPDMNEVTE